MSDTSESGLDTSESGFDDWFDVKKSESCYDAEIEIGFGLGIESENDFDDWFDVKKSG